MTNKRNRPGRGFAFAAAGAATAFAAAGTATAVAGSAAATAGGTGQGTNTVVIQQSGGGGGSSVSIEGLSVTGNRGGGSAGQRQGARVRVIDGHVFVDGRQVPDDQTTAQAADGTVFHIRRTGDSVEVVTGTDR